MSDSHKPKQLNLVDGEIKRGDTIEAWPFNIGLVPNPESAVVTFSMHLEDLDTTPLIVLHSGEDGAIPCEVIEGRLIGKVPMINAPAVGMLPWELQVRCTSLNVAAPTGGKWNRTIFEGVVVAIQDGAERTEP